FCVLCTSGNGEVTIQRRCGNGLPHCVVHRRPSTSAGASQGNPRISWLSSQDRVERLRRDKDVRENVGGCGSAGVQRGRHGRGSHSLPYQATLPKSTNHPAFGVLPDARANPV